MNICGYVRETINEGEGLRTVIFVSGCPFRCKGCHNPQSRDYDHGTPFTEKLQDKVIQDIKGNPLLKGRVTFCGGEPFANAEGLLDFTARLKREVPHANVWSYSGYTFEQLLKGNESQKTLLRELDVLIDGQFIEELKDLTLKFRGSTNQRIVDVKESLKVGKVVLYGD